MGDLRHKARPSVLSAGLRIAAATGIAIGLVGIAPTTATAAVSTYVETAEYTFEDGSSTGRSIASAGDTAVFTRATGQSVEVVTLDGAGSPVSQQTLTAPTPGGSYGIDVALNEDASLLYVAQSRFSQIHVYDRASGSWQLQRTLTAPTALPDRVTAFGTNIGSAIDVSGDLLVAGVPNATVDGARNTGFAFVVDLTTDVWQPLIPTTPIGNSITGEQVAISGTQVALGAPQVKGTDNARVGGVYLWDLASGTEPHYTSGPDSDPRMCISSSGSGSAFGQTLAFTGYGLAVGSPLEIDYVGEDPNDPETGCTTSAVVAGNTTQGAVYLFDAQLQQTGPKIVAPAHTTNFAGSIGASGDTLVVGGSQGAINGGGYAYVYDLETVDRAGSGDENGRQRPEPAQSLQPVAGSNGFGNIVFGGGIAATATQIVVGTSGGAGAAHVFGGEPAAAEPVVLEASDTTAIYGEASSLGAAVVSGDVPEGSMIRFAVEGSTIGEVEVADGAASVEVAAAGYEAGTYAFTAEPLDASGTSLGDAVAGSLSVAQATTETRVNESDSVLNVAVTAQHGTTPIGVVEIFAGEDSSTGDPVDTSELDGGAATWAVPASEADITYVVRYQGDTNHVASEASILVPAVDDPSTPEDPTDPPGPSDPSDPTDPSDPSNPSSPQDPDLPTTGADGAAWPWIIAGGSAIVLGGAFLLSRIVRRR